jgi:membrane-associated phospholipid phosphatase
VNLKNRSKIKNTISKNMLEVYIVSFLLGPMMMVNWIVKPLWGRSRPFQTLNFGGYETHTSILNWGSECSGNCSFVSGEVASMAWLFLILPIVPKNFRLLAIVVFVLLIATVAIGRLASGRHFLSDVIFSILIVYLCHKFVESSWRLWATRRKIA